MEYIVFSQPEITEGDVIAVSDVLRSKWIGKGPKTTELEDVFKKRVGAEGAVGLNSCTAALFLALKVNDIGSGDEVITTPLTFAATANVIVHVGAKPIFVDIDRKTFNIDAAQIEKAITPRTKAIIPVHFAGRPCDMDEIMCIAKKNKLRVIEDCAHSIESEYHGQLCGSFGQAACYSFYATKNITCGEGGMLALKGKSEFERAQILSLHGLSHHAWTRYDKEGSNFYEVVEHGYKYNMHDISAALVLSQYARIEENWKRRQANWNRYMVGLKDVVGISLPAEVGLGIKHACHLFTILLDINNLKISRNEFCSLLKEKNIGTGIHFLTLHTQPAFQETLGHTPSLPNAEFVSERTVSIPVQPSLSSVEVDYIIDTIKTVISENFK